MRKRIILPVIALALLSWGFVYVVSVLRTGFDVVVLFAALITVPVAVVAALGIAKFATVPHEILLQFLDALREGRVDGALLSRVQNVARAYADLVAGVTRAFADKEQTLTSLQQQYEEHQQEARRVTGTLAETQQELQRLNNVMVDRELRMIELKAELREAHKQLGVVAPATSPQEVGGVQQHDDPEHERAAVLNLLEDLQDEKKQLATAKAKDDAIFRSIAEGIIVADARHKITFLNMNARRLLNLGDEETVADAWSNLPALRDPATGKQLSSEELPLFGAVEGRDVGKYIVLVDDPETPQGRFLEMSATPVKVSGILLGGVATLRDITKEQEIDRAKTEFVSLASHQLRTPLSAINWYAEMLLAGDAGELNDEQREYLNEVYQGNQRMVDLINSLLNVSRLELGTFAIDPEDADVIALAESVLGELAPQVKERNITLNKQFDTTIPHLYADPKLLRMVLQNLASNAVKYTPPGGTVTITVGQTSEAIGIDVADTGLGIPQVDQSKIFSKLFRATNARESDTDGTGLGLYIVRSVVEHAGGTITFQSEEGRGTTFSVRLPKEGMRKREGTKSLS